jgi:hypothetical protein
MSKVQGGIDSGNKPAKDGANSPKGPQLKTALTEIQIAALAAGAVGATASIATTPVAPVAQLETPAPVAAEPVAQVETPEPVAATPAPVNEVVAMLQSQLAAAQGQVVALSVELQGAKAASESSFAAADKMRPIVRAAVGNLRVAMGGTAAGVDALADDGLMAEHANLSAQFTTKFKVGGVAAVSSGASAEKVGVDADPLRQARLAATRLS